MVDWTLPKDGQRIRGQRKVRDRQTGQVALKRYEGTVDFVFASPGPDDPAIKLRDGSHVFPSLGDTWEAV